jgi:hypothetical protein
MAAPEGNQNNKKGKMFYDALRKVLIQEPRKLTEVAEGLIEAAIAREPWAVKELMDRVDGKAIQFQEITGADGEPLVTSIAVNFVKPDEKND